MFLLVQASTQSQVEARQTETTLLHPRWSVSSPVDADLSQGAVTGRSQLYWSCTDQMLFYLNSLAPRTSQVSDFLPDSTECQLAFDKCWGSLQSSKANCSLHYLTMVPEPGPWTVVERLLLHRPDSPMAIPGLSHHSSHVAHCIPAPGNPPGKCLQIKQVHSTSSFSPNPGPTAYAFSSEQRPAHCPRYNN